MPSFLKFFLVLSILSGCSFIDSTVSPKYKKAVNNIKISQPIHVYLNPIINHASKRQGIKKTELGIVSANIYTSPEPKKLLKDALTLELENAGFKVTDDYKLDDYKIRIQIILNEFFLELNTNLFFYEVIGSVTTKFIVRFPDNTMFHRRIKGLGQLYIPIWTPFIIVGEEFLYKTTFELTMQDFMRKALPSFVELIQNYKKEGKS